MSTQITINEDQTLTVKWVGKRGRGSLFQIAAEGNAKNVNRLDKIQILAVHICVRINPFPLGTEKETYRKVLAELGEPEGRFANVVAKVSDIKLGEMRLELVNAAGSGFNAPHDKYITTAVEVLFSESQLEETPA
ncbi:MAG: hypothetical protein B7Z37_20960 [Verrucomicrobia bacterium 12-59-8]|nr:MAG: hypothetical protein B7Z37_20960 [Verrucomicrobia bacterium 12-59-8]